MRFFRIKNFERFQHYKSGHEEAAPIWIKFYRGLLSDFEFSDLPDASKAHLMLIWLLASQCKNRLPLNGRWIAGKIGAKEEVDLDILVRSGFIVVEDDTSASEEVSTETLKSVSDPTPKSTLECFRESGSHLISSTSDLKSDLKKEEGEREPEPGSTDALLPALLKAAVPIASTNPIQQSTKREQAQAVFDLWNATVERLPKALALTEKRIRWASERLKRYSLDQLREAFVALDASDFAAGSNWASFDWVIANDENPLKALEGKYDNKAPVGNTPASASQAAFDRVMRETIERTQTALAQLEFAK